jgi:hypothetical protein
MRGMFEQLLGRFGGVEDLDQIADPAAMSVRLHLVLLVRPVRGNAEFGLFMHLLSADLDLDAHPLGMDHRVWSDR